MTYEEQHRAMVDYLKLKVELGDWHAVWDAAIDLKTLEVEENARKQLVLSANQRVDEARLRRYDGAVLEAMPNRSSDGTA